MCAERFKKMPAASRKEDRPEQGQSGKRGKTDESLRVERGKADAGLLERRKASEQEADEVVEVARARADKVVQTARDQADSHPANSSTSPADDATERRRRIRDDRALEGERGRADSLLQSEREERRRYLSDFLAVERDATDNRLTDERSQVDKAISARDDFLATVSHDLRSLLGSLVFNAEILKTIAPEGDAGDRIREYAGMGRRLTARMNRLINDLLDVVSIDAGRLAVLPQQVDIATVLRDTVDAFQSIAAAARVTLEAEFPRVPFHAMIDDGRIAQVLANLVSNAIKCTPAAGKVSICVQSAGDEIVFTVTDTGIGIPKDQLGNIFERFHQVGVDRRGLGLGLYISRSLIEAHFGRIWAESEVGKGSSFHFALPAAPEESPPDIRA